MAFKTILHLQNFWALLGAFAEPFWTRAAVKDESCAGTTWLQSRAHPNHSGSFMAGGRDKLSDKWLLHYHKQTCPSIDYNYIWGKIKQTQRLQGWDWVNGLFNLNCFLFPYSVLIPRPTEGLPISIGYKLRDQTCFTDAYVKWFTQLQDQPSISGCSGQIQILENHRFPFMRASKEQTLKGAEHSPAPLVSGGAWKHLASQGLDLGGDSKCLNTKNEVGNHQCVNFWRSLFLHLFLLTSVRSWLGYLYGKKPTEIKSLGAGNMGTRKWLRWVDPGWMTGALLSCSVRPLSWTGERKYN